MARKKVAIGEPTSELEIKLLAALLYYPDQSIDIKQGFTNTETSLIYKTIKEWKNPRFPIPLQYVIDKAELDFIDENVIIKLTKEYNKIDKEEAKTILTERIKMHNFVTAKNDMLEQLENVKTHLLFANNHQEMEIALDSLEIKHYSEVKNVRTYLNNVFSDTEYIKTGISEIDQGIGISKGSLIAIMADTGMQKTMFTLWWLIKMLEINPNIRVAYFEKEMVENEIAKRLLSYLIQTPSTEIVLNKDKFINVWEQYKDVNNIINRFILVGANDFNNANDIARILEKEKIDVWVLDYLTELEQDSPNTNYEGYIKQQVTILKKAINKLNNVGIVLSQIKHTTDLHSKLNKITHPEDMEYGKTLRQNSSYIFSLFHPNYYDKTIDKKWLYMIPHKVRDRAKIETIYFDAYPETCSYTRPSNYILMDHYLQEYKRGKKYDSKSNVRTSKEY